MFQDTFLSVWYWIFAVLIWGVICNYTFGIPNELLMRSTRSKEEAEIFDRYARRNIRMFARGIARRGHIVSAIAAFVLAVVATLAIWRGQELAMGFLVILAPMAALWFWGGRMIARLNEADPDPEALRLAFRRERRLTGVVAGVSIVIAVWAATLRHGPGWTEVLFRGF